MGTDYIFSSAFIRSREKKLIKEEQFCKMTDSGNIDEVCSAIQNAGYGSEALPFRPDTYQSILADERSDMFREISEMSGGFRGLDVLIYVNDYHNIKVLLKSENLGADRSDILLDKGTVPVQVMTDAVRGRKGSFITENMYDAIIEAAEVFGRTGDPQYVDLVCDRYCFRDICEAAAESGSSFVQGYVRLWIDTVNLKTYLRVKALGYGWTYYRDVFIPGGSIDEAVYSRIFDADQAAFAARFNAGALYAAATEGRERLDKTGDYSLIEKLCDNAMMEYVRSAGGISYGPEVLFAYLAARQMEIKNIRILMAGRLAGLAPEKIAERIRRTYE